MSTTLPDNAIPSSAFVGKIRNYFKDCYFGKVKHPCDENCPDGCSGNHNYELPESYPELFNSDK